MNRTGEYLGWMMQDMHRRLWCEQTLERAIATELRWVNLFAHEAIIVMAREAVGA
jgi:hypothetical protein